MGRRAGAVPRSGARGVATRFAGTDGVSLEAEKWAQELRAMGHDVYYFAGVLERPPDKSMAVPEAYFGHADVAAISEVVFEPAGSGRPASTSRAIDELTAHLKAALYEFVRWTGDIGGADADQDALRGARDTRRLVAHAVCGRHARLPPRRRCRCAAVRPGRA